MNLVKVTCITSLLALSLHPLALLALGVCIVLLLATTVRDIWVALG